MNDNPRGMRYRRRVLILDFDFHTSVGGGQVFYRRAVERHPDTAFYYPSTSADLQLKASGKLPANAFPFAFDDRLDCPDTEMPGRYWVHPYYAHRVAAVGAAVQGMTFDVVDVPSFSPAAHIARQILTGYGVTIEKIALGLVGWPSVSARNGYEKPDHELIAALEEMEQASVEAADVRYTISRAEKTEQARSSLPVALLDMHDTLESFQKPDPAPPGDGPPDIWFVGRLDGAKGPDIFMRLVARLPRRLYNRCYFSGPDNTWVEGKRWSQELLELAASLRVQASYEGVLSDAEIRRRTYHGRTVLIVPSRNDAFNYVALEGILNGCPVLLSEQTGAFGFLRDIHPRLLPHTMRPDRLEEAAETLRDIVTNYDRYARMRRKELIDRPFPEPRIGFMDAVYDAEPAHSPQRQAWIGEQTVAFRERLPLLSPALRDWRPATRRAPKPRVSIVIPTYDRAQFLAPTLACLTRQTISQIEVIVIDDGSPNATRVRAVAESFAPLVRLIRTGNAGEAVAVNRGLEIAQGEFVGFLSDDDAYGPELLEESVAALDADPHAIGTYPDWDIVDTAGYLVEAHRLPEFDRGLMLAAHWCLPGPGVIVRREALIRTGGRDLAFRYVSDFDLWLRVTRYGPMIRLPRKLAYWRLHASNLTTSTRRREMADERITVMRKLFSEPGEPADPDLVRRAYAAAHAAAAAILGRDDAEEARKHLCAMAHLAPDLAANLPPNMAAYPQIWPSFEQSGDPLSARTVHV